MKFKKFIDRVKKHIDIMEGYMAIDDRWGPDKLSYAMAKSLEAADLWMERMKEFVDSEYSPASGWTEEQYRSAREATAHWLHKIKSEIERKI